MTHQCKRRPGGGGAAECSVDRRDPQLTGFHTETEGTDDPLKAESLRQLRPLLPAIVDDLDEMLADMPEQGAWTQKWTPKVFTCLEQAKRLTNREYNFVMELVAQRWGQPTDAELAELDRLFARVSRS